MAPIQWDGLEHLTDSFLKWWTAVTESQEIRATDDQINLTSNVLWQIWKARNDREFNQKDKEPHRIIEKAQMEWLEYYEANKGAEPRKSTREIAVQHRTNQNDHEEQWKMQLEILTQQNKDQLVVGIGIMATDSSGQLQAAWMIRERRSGDSLQDQAEAVKLAMIKAANQGWRHIQIEVDNKKLFEYIQRSGHKNSRVAALIDDIQSSSRLFRLCSFSFVDIGKIV